MYPHLVAALLECVVFDVDWLIDSFGQACAPEPINWPALRDAWLSIAHGVGQGVGTPCCWVRSRPSR